jgi:hypothetical protein
MTKDAHTSGPWKMDKYWDCVAYYSDARPDDFTFRVKFPDDMPKAEALANAHLIAAGPDMLEALSEGLEFLTGDDPLDRRAYEQIEATFRAAIAKATGM